jgi:hypothetical protein
MIEGRVADPVLAVQIRHYDPGSMLFQNPEDLLLAETALLIVCSFDRSLDQIEGIPGGNVNGKLAHRRPAETDQHLPPLWIG